MKPVSDRRLSDVVSVGLLTRVFPASLVDDVIAECGRTEQRSRTLTARVTAYFSIGMALNSQGSYEEVFEQLTDGLSWSSGWSQSWSPPTKSAIFQARSRLGYEPVRELFRRVARPLADTDTPGSWLAGRRLVALDGTCLDLPDTPANAEYFGRPGSSRGEKSAFPQARLVALAECGTHAVFDAAIGSCRTSERELAHDLFDTLEPGMLLLADRGLYGFDMWTRAAATGADLLWRVTSAVSPRHLETLDDGSWLAQIIPASGKNRQQRTPRTVRVIDYTQGDGRDNPEQYRLLTTILDPADASAEELALAYAQRWETENTFDELKTHQRGPRAVLRSKSPPLVEQEIWGHLCCHYAIRTLMRDAATAGSHDPDRMSFVAALRITRRSLSHSSFPLITIMPSPAITPKKILGIAVVILLASAWLVLAVMTFNLTRSTTLTGTRLARATTATIQRTLISVPARTLTLHLPRHWRWKTEWNHLFTHTRDENPRSPNRPAASGPDPKHPVDNSTHRSDDHPHPTASQRQQPDSSLNPASVGGSRLGMPTAHGRSSKMHWTHLSKYG